MQVTSEDKSNVNPATQETAEKPKRTRRRKVDVDQKRQTDNDTSSEIILNQLQTAPESPSSNAMENDTSNAEQMPELFGAAMGLETVPQHAHTSSVFGSGCGNILKAAREAQGLSILEVSNQLRLGVKQIQAIEQDDFAKLPQPSIVRGFIRNYARLLKVEAAPILEAYQKIVPTNSPLPLSVKSNASPSVIDKPVRQVKPQRLINLVILLVLIAILAYFYINHVKPQVMKDAALPLDVANISESTHQEISLPAPSITNTNATAESVPVDSTIAQENQIPVEENSNTALAVSPNEASDGKNNAPKTDAPENTVVTTPTPATDTVSEITTFKAMDVNKSNLMFTVTEDSWIRIDDAEGKKVFSEVLKAGSQRDIAIEKPIDITVGYAAATQLSIDNQPYDLTKATRGRVARIHLK